METERRLQVADTGKKENPAAWDRERDRVPG
jgi:hypothetical protein